MAPTETRRPFHQEHPAYNPQAKELDQITTLCQTTYGGPMRFLIVVTGGNFNKKACPLSHNIMSVSRGDY